MYCIATHHATIEVHVYLSASWTLPYMDLLLSVVACIISGSNHTQQQWSIW